MGIKFRKDFECDILRFIIKNFENMKKDSNNLLGDFDHEVAVFTGIDLCIEKCILFYLI